MSADTEPLSTKTRILDVAEALFADHGFDGVSFHQITAAAALPNAPPAEIYWGFHFVVGTMTLTFAETGRIDVLSNGLCASANLDEIYARMVPFLAAGFRAIAQEF